MPKKNAKDFKGTTEAFISAPEPAQEEVKTEGFQVPRGYKLVREAKSERVQLLMRPSIKSALTDQATEMGISLNEYVNRILTDHIEGKETT